MNDECLVERLQIENRKKRIKERINKNNCKILNKITVKEKVLD